MKVRWEQEPQAEYFLPYEFRKLLDTADVKRNGKKLRAHTHMLRHTFAIPEAQCGGVPQRRIAVTGAPQPQDHREALSEVRPAEAGAADAGGDGGLRAGTDAATAQTAEGQGYTDALTNSKSLTSTAP